ncbi:hypothetical protein CAter282_2822 [Collimonas arenae]|uniref:Uncharacterized protein n=1 Tax=Collimonas arenae TaxID=279058 RepID=A0A127QKM5_9BURK|nr:hypothetical protein CAter10_3109 [Collimonas arenae]AMP10546.1 hypothetical protein CAter282_2822 [Collimonas arenae]
MQWLDEIDAVSEKIDRAQMPSGLGSSDQVNIESTLIGSH